MISAMKTGKGRESKRGWECRGIKQLGCNLT